MPSRFRVTPLLPLSALALRGACAATPGFRAVFFRERAPAPIDRMVTASDARIDSLGRVAGSFVGEGTDRAVHLISSDSVFVRSLVEAYVPNIRRTSDFWSGVRARGVVRIPLREAEDAAAAGALAAPARVGSPAGRSDVLVTAITVRAAAAAGAALAPSSSRNRSTAMRRCSPVPWSARWTRRWAAGLRSGARRCRHPAEPWHRR
jgi:hypothetical protein